MPDANLDQAVDGIIGAAYGSAGERCMAVSVAVAVGDIYDKLVEKIVDKAEKLKVAPGLMNNLKWDLLFQKNIRIK